MKSWEDYKEYASSLSPDVKSDIEEASALAALVTQIIQQRNALGLTQRELAARSGLPQSSIARIETMKTIPNIETIIKILKPLGLQLSFLPISA